MKMADVAVLLDREEARKRWSRGENAFGGELFEILSHGGIPHRRVFDPKELGKPDVLLVALAGREAVPLLKDVAERGGEVFVFGSFPEMAGALGAEEKMIEGAGYAYTEEENRPPLRFLRACRWRVSSSAPCSARGGLYGGNPDGPFHGPLFHRFAIGSGGITHWAVDLPGTVVGLQQGTRPVERDGFPAPDGTAGIDDGILKADDGFEMDWEVDRARTETGERYFAHPYADLWKETLIGSLLKAATARGLTLPFVDYWPAGVSQVAMISLDSDWNLDDSAETTLRLLRECDVAATWCLIEPGYSPGIYPKVAAEGHELAFHYNAYEPDGGAWGREAFLRQLEWLRRAIGTERVVSNKNHYTRYEGWGELFRWCEEFGIRSDQTRGPSKKGNIGFLFGTCHPYFPIARADEENRFYDVLEISFLTQDVNLGRLADESVIVPFLEGVRRVRGVAHFLFHPIHLHREKPVRGALRRVVEEARGRNFDFWTGEQIDDWERRRRRIRLAGVDEEGRPLVSGSAGCEDAAIMVPVPRGREERGGTVLRHGVRCKAWSLSLAKRV
ncbi:hypothetical protein SAMN04488025_11836 [Planifilum fulgidum]|uniref:NodB homology domain-containing protein n=2 Tax=Planifilum fulgidum TaxID=201973 RepID=A0A1I2PI73_9BACL|nr:hypothetical protein [Planifilum fulgidum]SFG15862.1 hypothetical protein SAMN04488025_11836 [Planifilum fulgidum]